MSLKFLLEEAMKNWEWEDQVETNEENNSHSVSTLYHIDGNAYRMYIEAHENSHLVKLFLYSPVSIPDKRHDEACVVINRLNKSVYSGFIDLLGENIRYMHIVDVEGFQPDVQLVSNMRAAAGSAFRPEIAQALGTLAFTKLSAAEIIAQFEAPDDDKSDNTP